MHVLLVLHNEQTPQRRFVEDMFRASKQYIEGSGPCCRPRTLHPVHFAFTPRKLVADMFRASKQYIEGSGPCCRPRTLCVHPTQTLTSFHVRQPNDNTLTQRNMSNFDNTYSVYNTRVKRLGNFVTSSAPFGMWTYPDPLDGPSIAPCYGPYGEAAPPVFLREAVSLLPAANIIKSDILKPWERGTKSGKRRKSKLVRGGNRDAQEYASSDSSTTGSSGSGSNSNASSAATTPTEMSPQNSQATHDSQVSKQLIKSSSLSDR